MGEKSPETTTSQKVREALLAVDNVDEHGQPEPYHVNREAIEALDALVEQLGQVTSERDEWRRVAENLARDPEGEDA